LLVGTLEPLVEIKYAWPSAKRNKIICINICYAHSLVKHAWPSAKQENGIHIFYARLIIIAQTFQSKTNIIIHKYKLKPCSI
jgi:hypothetical protein